MSFRFRTHGAFLMVAAALAWPAQAEDQNVPVHAVRTVKVQTAALMDTPLLARSLPGEDFSGACFVMVTKPGVKTPTQANLRAALADRPSAEEAARRHFDPAWPSAKPC